MKRFAWMSLVIALVLAVGLAPGCAPEEEPGPSPDSAKPAEPKTPETITPAPPVTESVPVLLYFTRGEYLGVAGREVEAGDDVQSRATAAVEALLGGPTAQEQGFGLGTVIPAGTGLNDVKIEGSRATVDLTRRYESGGGSLSMLLRVAQIVYTLTQFEGVTEVAFKLDGALAQAIGGEGVVVSPAVTRADFEGQAPAILVESPVPGQTVSSPIKATGSANVFEAQFNVEVRDAAGKVVAEQSMRATSGTGTRGTFDARIKYTTSSKGSGTVVFFDISEADGSRIDEVAIPVTLQ